jgi:hypothetical protein
VTNRFGSWPLDAPFASERDVIGLYAGAPVDHHGGLFPGGPCLTRRQLHGERTDGGHNLVDYCANNPTLYAIADATNALKFERKQIRVVSVGVGEYPGALCLLLGLWHT